MVDFAYTLFLIHHMLKKIVLSLLTATTICGGQTFTNTVNKVIGKNTQLNYNVDNDPSYANMTYPLTLWFTYTGTPTSIEGELSHRGESVTLFENFTPNSFVVKTTPIKVFLGENGGGNWQFNLHSDSPFTVNQWGINVVPEPSTFMFMLTGLGVIMFFKK
jgi:hypothetical protein